MFHLATALPDNATELVMTISVPQELQFGGSNVSDLLQRLQGQH